MTEHMNIQNPEDFKEENYQEFEDKLFSPDTDVSGLEEICMLLAHIPSERAQSILARFMESERSSEVVWLEVAMQEGQFHYMMPGNEQEERDLLAAKIVQDFQQQVNDLEREYKKHKFELDRDKIAHEAVMELIKRKELDPIEEYSYQICNQWEETKLEGLTYQISVKKKVLEEIKKSIKTEKYKDMDFDTSYIGDEDIID